MIQIVRLHPAPPTLPARSPPPPPPLEPTVAEGAIEGPTDNSPIRARSAALREFLAQATGSLAAGGLRSAMLRCGSGATWAGAALTAVGLAATGWRAAGLAARVCCGAEGRAPWACRMALAALPLVVAVVGAAAAPTLAPATVAVFAGGLAERCVRDLTSQALTAWLPRAEAVDRSGQPLALEQRAEIEWSRSLLALPRTLVCAALQEALSPPLARALGAMAGFSAGGRAGVGAAIDAAGSSLLEAARAASGHQITEQLARIHGLPLHVQATPDVRAALARALDVASMREALALPGDMVDLLVGQPAAPLAAAGACLLRGSLKGLGEVRSALVNLGRAGQAQAALEPPTPVLPPA